MNGLPGRKRRHCLHEFSVSDAYHYSQSGPVRWIISHVLRYKHILVSYIFLLLLASVGSNSIPLFAGNALNAILQGDREQLVRISLLLLVVVLLYGSMRFIVNMLTEVIAKRVTRDARDELYLNLLGKSQTFHNRQRVGDIMARISNDMDQLSSMIVPGLDSIIDALITQIVTLVIIAIVSLQLLIFPLLYTIVFFFLLYDYNRRLHAVVSTMREQFSATNATLNEALGGIEVVKATAQERQEQLKFEQSSRLYRDNFVRKGRIQAFYLPLLAFSIALVTCFLHGFFLVTQSQLTLGGLIAFMGLAANLRNPVNLSLWTFELVQLGVVGARRVLVILKEESDLDENAQGYSGEMQGDLVFEDVTFGYGANPVLKHLSFTASRGQTIAIVGQTGSGKSTLARLVNRIYDTNSGRVLIDGRDVRYWNLNALRSQISTIEQDIFLFSRSIAQNISYGLGQRANRDAIEQAARLAQAHDFIMSFKDGYETEIGDRGVTLSGGQRQRIAIARALLTDPRILILDDSTSAVDSATEDEIQEAIRRVLQSRTTLLITHRLSQIRRADKILVLSKGELVDQGSHEELLERCSIYRRIFFHSYEAGQQSSLPEEENGVTQLSQPLTATGE